MNYSTLKSVLEGLLFVSGDEGISAKTAAEVVETDVEVVTDVFKDLQKEFVKKNRGIRIAEVAGGYRLTTVIEHAPYFEKLAYSPSRSSLSQAALETLAIIAYRQPITRIEIEEIRGVKADRPIHHLVNKDLIEEKGRADAIGRPILYGTTKSFLDYFGLPSIQSLPEPTIADGDDELEERTKMLFDRIEGRQLSLEDLDRELDTD
ncbi:SMC-Scp complex subunit ScpB [Cohnella sp. CIP 111063]|jgi:segregation and condensation protein B|uniref:SMC-Scp complex subunit ScpB n=1 Tax=unclassified Cohnella TaxID=2636738 RepID=UPI000B8C217F|nr:MULTISPECIES: SMC-Scp complex subunit ScpB [unclassified Cohnella]OXS61256.1 SMC-Scp complex subunit ScpB [Cohnella sp. CIP 111063]PRX73829.1 segregation and condensation protein B [Cohnella sp. SGD-V74]